MRSLHEAGGAVEAYSPSEELFNRRRRTVGLVLGPIVLIALLAAPIPLASAPHRLAAILAMMVVLWVTEALPLAVTALIGPVLAVILQVVPARTAFAPFADPIIFLFIGSFMLAEAMFVHGLDRRIAFGALSSRLVAASAGRILFVYGLVAAGISMWISNTATTAMMFPIGLSIVAHLTQGCESDPQSRDLATFCHGDDADGRLRRLDWGDRHADWNAAVSDRCRHVEPHRGCADRLLQVDAAGRAHCDRVVPVFGGLFQVGAVARLETEHRQD
jgi:di/tricarboxylate transporter